VHSLDPKTKLVFVLFFSLFLVIKPDSLSHITGFILLCLLSVLAQTGFTRVLKLLSGVMPFALIILSMHLISGVIESGTFENITDKLESGSLFSMRFILMIWSAGILGWTTRPLDMTDSLEIFFSPLSKINIPVRDISTSLLIGMRFIPAVFEDIHRIKTAQKARGAQGQKGFLKAVNGFIPIIVPLFVNSFHRADTVAIALMAKATTIEAGKPIILTKKWC
jgi:energy-coupling factor transport system permease protein